MKNNCDHIDEDGFSTLVFPKKKKYTGLYDDKIKCYCTKCHKTISITRKEYEEFIKEDFR